MSSLASISASRRLVALWQARSLKERKLLGVAGLLLLLLALVVLLGWLQSERRRLVIAVPLAESHLTLMQMAGEERQRLQTLAPPARLSSPALVDALQTTAGTRGLVLAVETIGDGQQVKGAGRFDVLLSWLANVQRDHALRLLRLDLKREGNVASFEATLVFPQPQ